MTDYDSYDDDYDDEYEEGYDEFDSSDDVVDLIECLSCGAMIYEESEQCPHCHEYVTHTSSPWSGRPWWWYVLTVAGSVAMVFALLL